MSANDDQERSALASAFRSLQGQKAAGRCLQIIVKRRRELSADSRVIVDSYLRIVEVPGFRAGKAPAELVLQYLAKLPALEHLIFQHCFPCWMELNHGLPERVAGAGERAAPGIDFATADWARIAEAVDPIAARTPRPTTREDVLLALFARRFGAFILGPDDEALEGNDADAEPTDAGTCAALDDVRLAGAEGAVGEAGEEEEAGSADEVVARLALEPAAAAAATSLRAIVSDLAALEATSAIWDGLVLRIVEELSSLQTSKLRERAAQTSRTQLAAALAALQASSVLEELAFLRLREQCAAWRADAPALGDAAALATRVHDLVAHVESHRAARMGAQRAENDEEFERHTTHRQESKRLILALIEELAPSLARPAELAGAASVAAPSPGDVPGVEADRVPLEPGRPIASAAEAPAPRTLASAADDGERAYPAEPPNSSEVVSDRAPAEAAAAPAEAAAAPAEAAAAPAEAAAAPAEAAAAPAAEEGPAYALPARVARLHGPDPAVVDAPVSAAARRRCMDGRPGPPGGGHPRRDLRRRLRAPRRQVRGQAQHVAHRRTPRARTARCGRSSSG